MILKKNKLHLLYERNKYDDVLVDSYGQLCFPFMSKCRYDVPLEEIKQPRFKAHTFDGIEVYHYSDTIRYNQIQSDTKKMEFLSTENLFHSIQ